MVVRRRGIIELALVRIVLDRLGGDRLRADELGARLGNLLGVLDSSEKGGISIV